MKLFHILLIIVLSFATAFGTAHYLISPPKTDMVEGSAFDRVMKSSTLRCGYAVATPWFTVEPNTKKLGGIGYDITNILADKIGLKVDWIEETGWGVAEQGLVTGRYDMLCGSVCVDPRRAKAATYSTPFLHIPILAVVRADDKRFDNLANPLQVLNAKDIKIGVKNGHVFEFIANEQFPLTEKIYANDISDDTEFFQMLKSRKIDIAFSGQITVDLYNEKNADKVKSLPVAVRFCNGAFMMPLGDARMKYMIDNAIGEINSSGQIRAVLNRYVKPDDPLYVRTPTLLFRDK
ncbi:MAG: transporter substrate-binding domain-containing protein [Alphaproteobacteria bacterium]|nr:transporter substrate-binding domain-containing protein [Alphaproteobacteria bacterium]